jgi:putative acetyltransferase
MFAHAFVPPANHILRPVMDADGPAIAALIAACFAEYDGCFYSPAEFPELVHPALHYAAKAAELWVLEDGVRLVGTVAVTPVPEQQACEITKVYLAASHRGSGAGPALMAHASQRAAAMGHADLVLWTDTRFQRAHRFYEKLGFVRLPVRRYLADVSHSWEYRCERRNLGVITAG